MDKNLRLKDLGERSIVQDLIVDRFKSVKNNFDDAAIIPSKLIEGDIVVTTDPCPKPVACILYGENMRLYGMMTVLINISDLAAMGAVPMGILISCVMPENMLVSQYNEFLDGIEEACYQYKCPLIGGNIKDGKEFSVTGTAFGDMKNRKALYRSGAKDGDVVCVIGDMGRFWSAVAMELEKISLSQTEVNMLRKSLFAPRAKLEEGMLLASSGSVTSCMDCSDGIIACLREISLASNKRIIIEESKLIPDQLVQKVANLAGVDFRNMMLSWGDWQLICTVKQNSVDNIKSTIEKIGTPFHVIGYVENGNSDVLMEKNNRRYHMTMDISSERFSDTSYFVYGLKPYLEKLKGKIVLRDREIK